MVDAADLKSVFHLEVRVQVPPSAPPPFTVTDNNDEFLLGEACNPA